ncbi:hypothetical protein TH53_04590 [Pedobacter lusitanus]|uniref:Uncharacterized protein n=1 Tax=Pedobacter lusitanus TaxID=1503925 RepID=A0A0D0GQ52_9SPHI|nr:hypothetical protein TH53_04590 [Pedobacter lusitanus]
MPWFIYKFPEDPLEVTSYFLVKGTPQCDGMTLCAIYADSIPDCIPACPELTPELKKAIKRAMKGKITKGVTLLRQIR